MADAYPMLVAVLVLAMALAGLRAAVGLLRRKPGPPTVGDRLWAAGYLFLRRALFRG